MGICEKRHLPWMLGCNCFEQSADSHEMRSRPVYTQIKVYPLSLPYSSNASISSDAPNVKAIMQ
jgi:hypothetical protein